MSAQVNLKAPFPYFGGKSTVASEVWKRFGPPRNYVEPFFGSGAMLLCNKRPCPTETVNDKDGYLANFWRSIQQAPEEVAHYADWPVSENDLHARHLWLVEQIEDFVAKLEGSPDFFCAKTAGWWVWGMCCWIGSGWCSGAGPWQREGDLLVDSRNRPHLGNAGQGVNRKLPHLGNGRGVNRKRPHLGNAGRGVNRQLPHLGNAGQEQSDLVTYLQTLSERLKDVRVCSGDWSRVCGPSVTSKHGLTAVFLDPPYSAEAERADLYRCESFTVAHRVRDWCSENGPNPLMRIALCGYEGEGHEALVALGWREWQWKARGGFGSQGESNENAKRERIWFSPHCLNDGEQLSLWEGAE